MENEEKKTESVHQQDGTPAASGAPSPVGAHPAVATAATGNAENPDHPDQDQDIALFKQLIGQYLGADHVENPEAQKMCQSIYKEAVGSGMGHDDAMKCAGHGLKAAALLGQKQTREAAMAQESADPEKAANSQSPPASSPGTLVEPSIMKQAGLPPPKAAQSSDKADDGKDIEESAKQITKLSAENAKLREAIARAQVRDHIEALLRESSMNEKTKGAFKELIKDKSKVEDINSSWKLFRESFERESAPTFLSFATERVVKTATTNSASISGFADCVKE